MSQNQVTVTVESNTYQFAKGLSKFIQDVIPMFQSGTISFLKVPAVLESVLTNLLPALQLISQLSAEEKEDLGAFLAALELNLNDIVKSLTQK